MGIFIGWMQNFEMARSNFQARFLSFTLKKQQILYIFWRAQDHFRVCVLSRKEDNCKVVARFAKITSLLRGRIHHVETKQAATGKTC